LHNADIFRQTHLLFPANIAVVFSI
jgi:hypothetical protein